MWSGWLWISQRPLERGSQCCGARQVKSSISPAFFFISGTNHRRFRLRSRFIRRRWRYECRCVSCGDEWRQLQYSLRSNCSRELQNPSSRGSNLRSPTSRDLSAARNSNGRHRDVDDRSGSPLAHPVESNGVMDRRIGNTPRRRAAASPTMGRTKTFRSRNSGEN